MEHRIRAGGHGADFRVACQRLGPGDSDGARGVPWRGLPNLSYRRAGRSGNKGVSDAQRQTTREAGEIAGLEVIRIVNEPTAAALVHEAAQHQGKRILVYDLGGGTFDASVVRIEAGVVEVISSHGNNHPGGDDFDHKIVEHILDHLTSFCAAPHRQTRSSSITPATRAGRRHGQRQAARANGPGCAKA